MPEFIPLLLVMGAASGFILCDILLPLRYKVARENGQRLYLRSFVFGVPCVLITILVGEFLFSVPELFNIEPLIFVNRERIPLYTYLSAPVATYIVAAAYNLTLSQEQRFKLLEKALLKDDFDAVLWRSMNTAQPVLVSLENRKVYVGLVTDGFEPSSEENSYLTILPLLSGYRTTEKMNFEISAVYTPVLKLLEDLENLTEQNVEEGLLPYYMAFPRSKINSLHLFNDHLYDDVSSQIGEPPS